MSMLSRFFFYRKSNCSQSMFMFEDFCFVWLVMCSEGRFIKFSYRCLSWYVIGNTDVVGIMANVLFFHCLIDSNL